MPSYNLPANLLRTLRRFLLMSCALFCSTLQAEPSVNPAIDAIFSDYHNSAVPGCALGVIQDGEFIYRQGYGMANLEFGIPIDSEIVFRTGSVGKQFTATVLLDDEALGRGWGRTKKDAEQAAAAQALTVLNDRGSQPR